MRALDRFAGFIAVFALLAVMLLCAKVYAQPIPSGSLVQPKITLTNTGNVVSILQGAKLCFNKTTCSATLSYDGTNFQLAKPLVITQAAASLGFNFSTTQVKLALGNTGRYIYDVPTGTASSLPSWDIVGVAELRILGAGTSESGTLFLQQASSTAFNHVSFADESAVIKMNFGWGNSGVGSPYTSSPFLFLGSGLQLPIVSNGTEKMRLKVDVGTFHSSAASGVAAFAVATDGARYVFNSAATHYIMDDGAVNLVGADMTIASGKQLYVDTISSKNATGILLSPAISATQTAVRINSSASSGSGYLLKIDNNSANKLTLDYTGILTVTGNIFTTGGFVAADIVQDYNSVTGLVLKGTMPNGATAIAITSKSSTSYSTAGAEIHSFKNNTTEVAAVPSYGGFYLGGMTTTAINNLAGADLREGTMVWDTTLHKAKVYSGSGWETVTSI